MSMCLRADVPPREPLLESANRKLAELDAQARVEWAFAHLPGRHVLSSSFGAQAAVSLHLVTRVDPGVPVVVIDTGYLFPETYQFIEQLTERLDLNLHVYRSRRSAAWQEASEGRRWEQGESGLAAYNRENKVEPMQRALAEIEAGSWIAGLRAVQSDTRAGLPVLSAASERWKLHPIIDWSDRDVYRYLQRHDLPYHPLWEKGYVSIGDTHTTRALHEVDDIRDTRFFGLKRECGLHEMDFGKPD
jgi:phosphoadenosine phosphosulfate reductase